MSDSFKPLSEVEWVTQLVCDRYLVRIPKFLADGHKWWGDWEKERFASMEKNLKHGDVLFDIGAETGWQSAIYAQFVGAGNMCLFEPTPENWPNIRATWLENKLLYPKATCCALVSDANVGQENMRIEVDGPVMGHWPSAAYEESLLENVKYNHIDEDAHRRPQITLDRFFELTNIEPRALTIDVEGAELLVLQGAKQILRTFRPLVWASLHEGLTRPGVNPKNKDVHDFMVSCFYMGEHLGTDHEEHWLYRPVPK